MKVRKILLSVFVGVLVLSLFNFVGNAKTVSPFAGDLVFSDVNKSLASYTAVQYLKDEGIVVGYEDGTFGIDKNINRAEFLKIVMEAKEIEVSGKDCYKDVKDEWFAPYVCTAKELGYVNGYADGSFKPGNDINFAEASKIVVNILALEKASSSDSSWYGTYVSTLVEKDAVPGSIEHFDHKLKRSEMAEMIWRLMTETTYKISNTYENLQAGIATPEVGGELVTFESCGELKDYIEDNAPQYYQYDEYSDMDVTPMPSSDAPAETGSASKSVSEDSANSSGEYSSTNVQVEGVDEADIVKNDGKYIYLLKGSTVRVVEAYPASEMVELDEITFDDTGFYPSEMYLDGDRLVVIGYSYESLVGSEDESYGYWYGSGSGISKVYIFDVSDKSNVELLRQLAFEGSYVSSRKVGDVVYLVSNKYMYYYPVWEEGVVKDEDIVPMYSDNGEVEKLTTCGNVKYVPGVVDESNYMVIAAIPVDDVNAEVEDQVVVGSSSNIYASTENLYVAQPKYNWYGWWEETGGSSDEETYIHKFSLDGTNVEYKGVGSVPGTILNQFSMDENGEYFRIATTKGNVWDTVNPSTNNLYVMDGSLNVIGKVEGLAPHENIYSVRFLGDRAYIVTFKKVDPLFVLDLSEPTNPKVLGKLKIPGFSDYLHPYDENHIIGFGKDTATPSEEELAGNGLDFAWYQGIKVAMFDVTDVENPVELHKVVIGDRGTDSPLLWNHKALLFDKEKGFMAFPITVAKVSDEIKNNPEASASSYGDYVFQGAYVYDVSIEDGFTLRGTITHYTDDEVATMSGEYWYGDKDISRIIYIGDYFYTISNAIVKASGMEDLIDVKTLELK